ncbi:MAG TPA: sigma-70 family RNA polymerase sigma factor [Polyangia bacterium]|nr:sigma-70 family RNA polymerase sigma factor [Polyangia bacterium]
MRTRRETEPLSTGATCLDAFRREVDYVYRTLRRLGTAPSELEDLAQEVFVALCRAWPDYDARRPLRPYLFGIAFRIAASHQRKRRREVALTLLEVPDTAPGPDDLLAAKKKRALLLMAIESVPLRRRAVLIMHELDGVPVQEIAATLGVPRFTIYSRLRTARHELESAVRRLQLE